MVDWASLGRDALRQLNRTFTSRFIAFVGVEDRKPPNSTAPRTEYVHSETTEFLVAVYRSVSSVGDQDCGIWIVPGSGFVKSLTAGLLHARNAAVGPGTLGWLKAPLQPQVGSSSPVANFWAGVLKKRNETWAPLALTPSTRDLYSRSSHRPVVIIKGFFDKLRDIAGPVGR